MYVSFINLENTYDREALLQVFRMYDVGGNQLCGIKSMYVYSLSCVRVKEGKSE